MSSIEFFLPESLVKLVFKITKIFEISDYNLFSILDTLRYALQENYQAHLKIQKPMDEKEMTILIVNIIRLSEKYNRMSSKLTKIEINKIYGNLQIDEKEFNGKEFEHFKSFNFKVEVPTFVETIYGLIDTHLDTISISKESLMKFALDVLKVFYCWRIKIFEDVEKSYKDQAMDLVMDAKLLSVSILFVVLKILNVSERVTISVFDAMCDELDGDFGAKEVNYLSGVIFGFIKNE